MQQRVQTFALRLVGEHDPPELRAIKRAVRAQHIAPKRRADRLQSRRARRDHLARRLICIEHVATEPRQQF